MIAINKLKGLIVEKGFSQAEIAEKLEITPKTMYQKMKKGVFLSSEIEDMIRILEIDNPLEIFFANEVSQQETYNKSNGGFECEG